MNEWTSESLNEKHCSACRLDAPQLTGDELRIAMSHLANWELAVDSGVNQLLRVYTFKNFVEAMAFTHAVANLAEGNGHHPALLTEWGKVSVRWWTHKIHGLHENDVIMAAKTERLYLSDFAPNN
jgi:4a-hydroxytetrahydrobiopterin dehydratase